MDDGRLSPFLICASLAPFQEPSGAANHNLHEALGTQFAREPDPKKKLHARADGSSLLLSSTAALVSKRIRAPSSAADTLAGAHDNGAVDSRPS
jgi:hypothetical protein